MTQTDGKIYHVLELEESILSKMTILPKAIYRFNAITIKLPLTFFTELEQNILKYVCKHKTWIAKVILREKNGWRNQVPWPQTTLQSYGHQNSRVLAVKQKYRSEQDRKPRNKPIHLWSINLWQRRQEYKWRKDSLFNKRFWENWSTTCKRKKLEHSLIPYIKINSKWINDPNIRPYTVTLLKESKG